MRASDFGGWIRAWERLCAGWSMPSSYSQPTAGRVRMLSRPKSIRTRPPLERCLVETTVERRDTGGAPSERWSVEATAPAPAEGRDNGEAARPRRVHSGLGAPALSRQRTLMQTRCSRRLRPSRASAAAGGSALDDRAAAGIGGAASAQEDRDGDDDEP